MKSEVINNLHLLALSDLKLEVVLAELIEMNYLDLNELSLRPLGLFKRSYTKDIVAAEIEDFNSQPRLRVETYREGIYDTLPKTLFLNQSYSEPFKPIEKRVADWKINKEKEISARKFFHPIDQEFIRKRIEIELVERQLIGGFANLIQKDLFSKMLGEVDFLNEHQKQLFFFLLPLTHKITGDLILTARCFEIILGHKVSIRQLPKAIEYLDESHPYDHLGSAQLGVDFVLGGELLNELSRFQINVESIPMDNMVDFLPEGRSRACLNFLIEFFLPIEWEIEFNFSYEIKEALFKLGPGKNNALLGHSTQI